MTEPKHFDKELQAQFQQDKAQHAMPTTLEKRLMQQLEQNTRSASPRYAWWRGMQLALSSVFVLVLGYLLLQPVEQASYIIAVSYADNATEVQQHSVVVRSVPAVVVPFTADESQQRYKEMLLAQHNIQQFHAEQGVLQKVQQHWQIRDCNEVVVQLNQELLAQLKLDDRKLQQLQQAQSIDFFRGPQGQLLAIQLSNHLPQCPHS